MKTVRNDNAALATARNSVYELLASVFRTGPSAAMIDELKGSELSTMLSQLGFPVEEHLHRATPHQLSEDLDVEYTRLFIGPGSHISPHESIHTEHGGNAINELWGRETVKVKAFIEEAGLTISEQFEGLPDHISAEFELMAHLAGHEAELWTNEKPDEAALCHDIQRLFFAEHIDQWVPLFCAKINQQEGVSFYKAMADLTVSVLEFERDIFEISEQPAALQATA